MSDKPEPIELDAEPAAAVAGAKSIAGFRIKKADHPLTPALVQTLPSGEEYIAKIYVRFASGAIRLRRPKWIARWEGWFVYDSGWMDLSQDRSRGWQTEESRAALAQASAK